MAWYKARQAAIEAERTRPRTPEETRMAQAQMQVALLKIREYLKTYSKSPDYVSLGILKQAAAALNKARKLDSNATVFDTERKDNIKLDLDMLAAELCYYEAFLYEASVPTVPNVPDDQIGLIKEIYRRHNRERKEALRKALKPAVRAVELQPHNLLYMQLLIKVYALTGHYRKAKELKTRALKIDPYNPETLTLLGNK
jgi:tetratricopeptide (TPR) repeat protein